jgi:hypothetical protein
MTIVIIRKRGEDDRKAVGRILSALRPITKELKATIKVTIEPKK